MAHAQSDTDIQCAGTDKEMDHLNSWDTKYLPLLPRKFKRSPPWSPADLSGAAKRQHRFTTDTTCTNSLFVIDGRQFFVTYQCLLFQTSMELWSIGYHRTELPFGSPIFWLDYTVVPSFSRSKSPTTTWKKYPKTWWRELPLQLRLPKDHHFNSPSHASCVGRESWSVTEDTHALIAPLGILNVYMLPVRISIWDLGSLQTVSTSGLIFLFRPKAELPITCSRVRDWAWDQFLCSKVFATF
jgi:hypothetical protein